MINFYSLTILHQRINSIKSNAISYYDSNSRDEWRLALLYAQRAVGIRCGKVGMFELGQKWNFKERANEKSILRMYIIRNTYKLTRT